MPDAAGLELLVERNCKRACRRRPCWRGLLGSNEYFSRVQSAAATTRWSDPNQAASDMIGNDGLFTGPLPNAEYLAHRLANITLPPAVATNTAGSNTAPASGDSNTTSAPAVTSNGVDNSAADTSAPAVDPSEYNAWAEAASNGVPPPASLATDPAWTDSGAYTTLLAILANSQQNTWYASDPYAPGNINNIDPSA